MWTCLFFLSFIAHSPGSTPNPALASSTPLIISTVPVPARPGSPMAPTQSPESASTQGLDEIDTLTAHDASQLACSFQDAFDGGESGCIEDDIDDTGANAPDGQDDDELLVHVSGRHCDLSVWPCTDCCQASACMQSTQREHGSVCMFSWKLQCWLMVIL